MFTDGEGVHHVEAILDCDLVSCFLLHSRKTVDLLIPLTVGSGAFVSIFEITNYIVVFGGINSKKLDYSV